MFSRSPHRRRALSAVAIGLLVVSSALVAGCGSDDPSSSATSGSSPAAATKDVSVALDWTPNTNHIGVYVAEKLGLYKQAGLNVKVLPYASTSADALVANGKADFGFSYEAGVLFGRAAGAKVKSVYTVVQHNQYAIGVKADGAVKRPRDLDGKTYAGFGTPDEGLQLKTAIQKDGGKGTFKSVTLDTAAYEAVYGDKADFTITVSTWEGIEAKLRKKPLTEFGLTEYGVPEQYSSVIIGGDDWLAGNADTAKSFLTATQKGYAYAADHPVQAAKLLVEANASALKNPELVTESAQALADGHYLRGENGAVGTQDAAVWSDYGTFLFDRKALVDGDGKALTAAPDFASYFTNEYLPAAQ